MESVQLNFSESNIGVLNFVLAIIMFGVALEIRVEDFRQLLRNPRAAALGLIAQFFLLPLFTFALVWLLEPPPQLALGMILVAACPGGNISNFIAHLSRGNTALSVSLTAAGTFLALFLTPLNFNLWGSLYEPTSLLMRTVSLDWRDVFNTIILIAGIPLAIGMIIQHRKPKWATAASQRLKPLSILAFLGFVGVAFYNNQHIFLEYIEDVFFLVLAHNLVALSTGFLTARWGGLPLRDQKTIAIETGIQNSGLGLALLFTFFTGMGGAALVAAWWGIWHIVSGLTLGFYWSRSSLAQPA
jgi:BASS family bile acid:Na+ symporter